MRARHVLFFVAGCIALAANADATPQGFKSGSVVLYQPDAPLSARLSSDAELASYIKRLEAACTAFFASENAPEQLDVVVGLKPAKKVRVWFVSSRRSSQDKSLRALRTKLEAIPPCEVHSGPVAFALCCTIAGASPRKDKEPYQPPMPKEWRDATAGKDVLVPDGIFERIWRD
jgi:hypothetical protein